MKLGNFKEKRFRYGTFSTAMMLFAFVIFVLVNLVADEFNRTYDLTGAELFTLTHHSHNFLATLNQDITISLIAPTGAEEPILSALLEEYASASSHISVAFRDPLINPGFVQSFATNLRDGVMPNQSVIVQSGNNYRVVTPDAMITPAFNERGQMVGIRSYNFERQITTAIRAVTLGEMAVLYKVTGSGEMPLEPGVVQFLETENFIVRTVSVLEMLQTGIPETADILLLSTPERDWPEEKANTILAFLENEGRAFITLEPMLGRQMPNFARVLAAYGLQTSDYFIMDLDPRQHIIAPWFALPQPAPHEITIPLVTDGQLPLMLRFSAAIEPTGFTRASTTFEPLLASSMLAHGRENMALESPLFHPDYDTEGPFLMGIALTDAVFTDRNIITRMVIVGSSDIWAEGTRGMVGDNNLAFLAGSLRWLSEQDQGIFIPTRTPPGITPLMMTQFQSNAAAGFSMGVLPGITLLAGLIIWYRRKNA